MSLAGKFFMHLGKEHGHTGVVVQHVEGRYILVRMDRSEDMPTSMQLLDLVDISADFDSDGDIFNEWEFFDTREQLEAFDEWLSKTQEKFESAEGVARH